MLRPLEVAPEAVEANRPHLRCKELCGGEEAAWERRLQNLKGKRERRRGDDGCEGGEDLIGRSAKVL